jgi:hypothetical protein
MLTTPDNLVIRVSTTAPHAQAGRSIPSCSCLQNRQHYTEDAACSARFRLRSNSRPAADTQPKRTATLWRRLLSSCGRQSVPRKQQHHRKQNQPPVTQGCLDTTCSNNARTQVGPGKGAVYNQCKQQPLMQSVLLKGGCSNKGVPATRVSRLNNTCM